MLMTLHSQMLHLLALELLYNTSYGYSMFQEHLYYGMDQTLFKQEEQF